MKLSFFRSVLRSVWSSFSENIDQGQMKALWKLWKWSLHTSQVAHQAWAYPGFLSMKRPAVFRLLSGCGAGPSLGCPSIKFAGTHLYTWEEIGTVRVKCLAQEHNTMSQARPRTRLQSRAHWPWGHRASTITVKVYKIIILVARLHVLFY